MLVMTGVDQPPTCGRAHYQARSMPIRCRLIPARNRPSRYREINPIMNTSRTIPDILDLVTVVEAMVPHIASVT